VQVKTWKIDGARAIRELLSNSIPPHYLCTIGAYDPALTPELRAFAVYVPANNVRRFEASFWTLGDYDIFYLLDNDNDPYAEYDAVPDIERPSGFTLELSWEHTLNASDFDGLILDGIWDRMINTGLGPLAFESIGIVHSTGTAWEDVSISTLEVNNRYVVVYSGSYPTGVAYSNISTIRILETVTSSYITSTVTPFDKPTDAELLIDLRVTIDISTA